LSESDLPNPNSPLVAAGERDAFYLAHMLECIESIERYSGANDIKSDELTQDAVLRKLQLLAESSKRISDALKAESPEIPWRELAGFRNVVVHDYLGIRVERIVPIVHRDIPALKDQIIDILSKIEKQQT
jgi:uncharacterized protein with HEPN domain